ncbi:energy transducer TonB [Flavobacterium sp. SH_e]|uniref:energy transducer TonB n=1 Tax=Flavobacterium TaxID=237 RepID=UPI0021E3D63F|nr:energy transducer TonB [Flavobacterium sp. SH_e]MCV2485115.1 energy transducer TonB [Flavobacterium sp. SH_e]
MIRIFFATVSLILFFSCQNKSIPAVKDSENNRKVLPQKAVKTIRQEKNSSVNDNEVYKIMDVDVKPSYIGGIDKFHAFLNKNYIVPKDLDSDDSVRGGVFASFIIEKDGSVSNIDIIRDFGYGTGKELERVLKLCPNWIPAMKNGNPVRCLYSVPYYVQ